MPDEAMTEEDEERLESEAKNIFGSAGTAKESQPEQEAAVNLLEEVTLRTQLRIRVAYSLFLIGDLHRSNQMVVEAWEDVRLVG